MKSFTEALADCNACLSVSASYFKALRTRGRVQLALEEWEAAIRDFKAAYELAPSGSADEAGLMRDVKDAEAKFKKSKMKVRSCSLPTISHPVSHRLRASVHLGSLQDPWYSVGCDRGRGEERLSSVSSLL